jgi:enoyl-CoA hydratase
VSAEEAYGIGLVDRLVPAGAEVEEARRIAEALASVPQDTLRSDRRAVYEGVGRPLEEGLALEADLGRKVLATAVAGAARFAAGEGRSGTALGPG